MTVLRQELSEALAEYLRTGENAKDLDKIAERASDSEDFALYRIVERIYDDNDETDSGVPIPWYGSTERWEEMRRILAFLQTKYELKEVVERVEWTHGLQQLSLGCMALAVAGLYGLEAAGLREYWPAALLVPSALFFLVAFLFGWDLKVGKIVQEGPYWPFENERQWREHEHLSARFELPETISEEPAPEPQPRWARFIIIACVAVGVALIAYYIFALAMLIVWTVFLWPRKIVREEMG